jgi:ADP-ribose pyrophosphatase YjhB (NUDIX family)
MTDRVIRVSTRTVIFNQNNEILVEHSLRLHEDYYYLPGGGVLFHEKIEDGLVREVKEETGLEVKAERLLWVRDFVDGFPDLHGIELFFLATIIGGQFKPEHHTEPIEHLFMEVEMLENINFYPESFIEKLKIIRDDRNWSETNP